jgi:hypothetical protein
MYERGTRAALSTPAAHKKLPKSGSSAWLCTPVFWQTLIVTPNYEDPPVKILPESEAPPTGSAPAAPTREVGGRLGPEPTRYGDWELKGRCIDF